MFERLTERARYLVVQAQEEARELGHDHIGPEHLLLALAAEPELDLSADVLRTLGVSRQFAHDWIVREIGLGTTPPLPALPFQSATKQALASSVHEALALGAEVIGTEHVLLGLLRESPDIPVRVLADSRVLPEQVRAAVIEWVRPELIPPNRGTPIPRCEPGETRPPPAPD